MHEKQVNEITAWHLQYSHSFIEFTLHNPASLFVLSVPHL